MTDSIIAALEEKLERLGDHPESEVRLLALMQISARSAKLPNLDDRPEEVILGYESLE